MFKSAYTDIHAASASLYHKCCYMSSALACPAYTRHDIATNVKWNADVSMTITVNNSWRTWCHVCISRIYRYTSILHRQASRIARGRRPWPCRNRRPRGPVRSPLDRWEVAPGWTGSVTDRSNCTSFITFLPTHALLIVKDVRLAFWKHAWHSHAISSLKTKQYRCVKFVFYIAYNISLMLNLSEFSVALKLIALRNNVK